MARRRRSPADVTARLVRVVLEHPLVDRRLRRVADELHPSLVVDTPDAWTLLSARRITAADGAQLVVVHLASRVGIQWGLWRLDTGELVAGLHATGQLTEARLPELGVEQLTHTPVEETELEGLRSVLQLDKALWSPRGPERWTFSARGRLWEVQRGPVDGSRPSGQDDRP